MSNKSKNHGNKPHPDPHQNSGQENERKIRGDIHVHGEVEANLPPDLLKQHKAERNEDAAQANKNYIVQVVMLGALIIYSGLTGCQAFWMRQSVINVQDNFVKEQRAWISVSMQNFFPLDGPTIPVKIQIINSGKTAAKNVNGDFFATVLNKGERPPFDQYTGRAHNRIYAGGIFPSETPPVEGIVTVVKYGPPVPDVVVPTPELRQRIANGDSFIIFFGKITYCDVFHVKHSTTFCNGTGKAMELSGVKECIGYNDVDTDTSPSADCK